MIGSALVIALNQLYVATVRVAKHVESEQARVVAALSTRRALSEAAGCDPAVSGFGVGGDELVLVRGDGARAGSDVLARFPEADAARLRVRAAIGRDREPLHGRAMVSVETNRGPVATVGLRCGLPERCEYDAVSGACRGEQGR